MRKQASGLSLAKVNGAAHGGAYYPAVVAELGWHDGAEMVELIGEAVETFASTST